MRDMARAAAGAVEGLGGALDRTMQAIEPFIAQMKLEDVLMRAPAFWRAPRPPSPRSCFARQRPSTAQIAARRMRRPGERASVPVICVGNFTAGGAGKTPTALALARMLPRLGAAPALPHPRLWRPARRPGSGRPDPARRGRRRRRAAAPRPGGADRGRARPARRRAPRAASGASVIVMDDGLQNPSLRKDLALAVVDGETGIGNGLCLPAGPLRAPLSAQWPLVDALVLIGEGDAGAAVARAATARGKPVLRASLRPEADTAARLQGRRVLAFAGIGRPEKFFATLEASGAVIARRRSFPDHHPYRAAEVASSSKRREPKRCCP